MLIFVLWSSNGDGYYFKLLGTTSLYVLLILIGVSFFLVEKEPKLANRVIIVTSSVLISFVGFQFHLSTDGSIGTYETLGTHLVASGFFGLLMIAGRGFGSTRAPKFITRIADLVYPMYLLHTAVGLSTMAVIRGSFNNHFVMLAGAIFVTILVAWVAHVTVEKPFIRLGRRLAPKNNESRGSNLKEG
jgi:peptidoglycan/LPS O-acetylase OafA/YrhL